MMAWKTASVRCFQAQAYDVNSTIPHAACDFLLVTYSIAISLYIIPYLDIAYLRITLSGNSKLSLKVEYKLQ